MAYRATEEAPTERLLHIYLEPRPSHGGDHRHINLRVIRRAMSHVEKDGHTTWWDDKTASGYRCASWSSSKENAIFVDDLNLRGQIDAYGDNKMCDGKPYGMEVDYRPYKVDASTSAKIADGFKKLARAYDKLVKAGHEFPYGEYSGAVRQLALSLGIKRIVIMRREYSHASYSDARAYQELPLAEVSYAVNEILSRIHN